MYNSRQQSRRNFTLIRNTMRRNFMQRSHALRFASLGIACALIAISAIVVATRGNAIAAFAAEKLNPSRARRAIARTAGIELPTDSIEVEQAGISVLGSSAVVEAKVKTAFRLVQTSGGDWEVAEIRLGGDKLGKDFWEDVALLRRALDKEKTERALAELTTLQTALESFRRERGHYPPVETGRELVDHLNPRYLPRVIRLDPWQQPYDYALLSAGYRLRSNGADRRLATADDVIVGSAN